MCRSSGLVNLSLVASKFTSCERTGSTSTLHTFLTPRSKPACQTPQVKPHSLSPQDKPACQTPQVEPHSLSPQDKPACQTPQQDSRQSSGANWGGSSLSDGIDKEVFQALPAKIQEEILLQSHSHKGRQSPASGGSPDIKKYFTARSSRMGDDPVGTPPAKRLKGAMQEGSVVCEKCQQCVPVWSVEEHKDYHFALELQRREREEREERREREERDERRERGGETTGGKPSSEKGKGVRKQHTKSIQNFFVQH